MKRKKLLLHTCCAPCMIYVYQLLEREFDITIFFFNPNIMPAEEYRKRLDELISFSRLKQIKIITEQGAAKDWVKAIKDYRYLGEKSSRCRICYDYRLEETFKKGADLHFDVIATTLSISPHKNSSWLNESGLKLSEKYSLEYLVSDFKKNDGFKKSSQLSREHNFYRQNYCGCIYSKLERDNDSAWSKKSAALKGTISHNDHEEEILPFPETGAEIDLHHFHPADTEEVVTFFLNRACERKYKTVKIIHGKGKSVKKNQVYSILKSHPAVISFSDDSWNWGSTLAHLSV